MSAIRSRPIALFLTAVCAALSGCGGGGSSAAAAPDAPPAPPVISSAYAKQKLVVTVGDSTRTSFEDLALQQLAMCNNFRTSLYPLAAQTLPEDLLARTRFITKELYFSGNRSASSELTYALEQADFPRWQREYASLPLSRVAPPDCSAVVAKEVRSAKLLVDGVEWDLNYQRKEARGTRKAEPFTAVPGAYTDAALAAMERPSFLTNERCYLLPAAPPAGGLANVGGRNCIWDRFAKEKYLNFPWVMQGDSSELGIRIRTETEQAWVNQVVAPSVFQLPADFTQRMVN
jgi:hypothetical protein